MMRSRIAFVVVAVMAVTLVVAELEKGRLHSEAPDELKQWSFLIGEWKLESRRYSLDGPVIEENRGISRFSLALDGLRIQESQSITFAGQSMNVLNIFAFHPEQKHWEIARTDSLHTNFSVLRGTMSDDAIVLFERNPRPGSEVKRRYTYSRTGDDSFRLLLEFSLDEGESWLRRSETLYRRR